MVWKFEIIRRRNKNTCPSEEHQDGVSVQSFINLLETRFQITRD